MTGFFDKENFTEDDIQSFINNEIEESIHLDFKSAAALDRSDNKKREISKDVSAFANSDGGLIIYGINEKDHKAHSISYIDGKVYTKEWLEQLINTTIQRRIPDLQIFPVRFQGKIEQSVYVVRIPRGHDTPHMGRDNRFYKRFNFESVMMEEYEVRELYGRKSKSLLTIEGEEILHVTRNHGDYNEDEFQIQFVAPVFNDGDRSEADYKINVYFENVEEVRISWMPHEHRYHSTRYKGSRIKISSLENPTIYPGEKIDSVKVFLAIPKLRVFEILRKLKFEIKLYYSNGESEIKGDFLKLIETIKEKSLLE